MEKFNVILDLCKEEVEGGKSESDIIGFLFRHGLTVGDSINVFRELYDVSLDEAKDKVTNHEEWKKMPEKSDEAHKKLITEIEKIFEND